MGTDSATGAFIALAIIFVFVCLILMLKAACQIQPYQQGVVTFFGAYRRTINPGFHILSPIAVVARVDLRPKVAALPAFSSPAADGSPWAVSARADYKVVNAAAFIFKSSNPEEALQRSLKEAVSVAVSRRSPEAVLASGWSIAQEAQDRVASASKDFGVAVDRVTVTITGSTGPMEYFSRETPPSGKPLPD